MSECSIYLVLSFTVAVVITTSLLGWLITVNFDSLRRDLGRASDDRRC